MLKPRRRLLLILVSTASVLAVSLAWIFLAYGPQWFHAQDLPPPDPQRQKYVEEKVLGPDVTAFLRGPVRVEAVLLDDDVRPQGEFRRERTARITLPAHLAERMQALLRTETTYDFELAADGETLERAKACAPVYQARLEFWSGNERLRVDFCFGCYILDLRWADRHGETADFQAAEFVHAFQLLFRRDKKAARFD